MRYLSDTNYHQLKELAEELLEDYESGALTFCRVFSLGIGNPRKELQPIYDLIKQLSSACNSRQSLSKFITPRKISEFKTVYKDFEISVKGHAADKYIGMLFNPIVVATSRVQENHFKKMLLKFRNVISLLETAHSYINK